MTSEPASFEEELRKAMIFVGDATRRYRKEVIDRAADLIEREKRSNAGRVTRGTMPKILSSLGVHAKWLTRDMVNNEVRRREAMNKPPIQQQVQQEESSTQQQVQHEETAQTTGNQTTNTPSVTAMTAAVVPTVSTTTAAVTTDRKKGGRPSRFVVSERGEKGRRIQEATAMYLKEKDELKVGKQVKRGSMDTLICEAVEGVGLDSPDAEDGSKQTIRYRASLVMTKRRRRDDDDDDDDDDQMVKENDDEK